VSVVNTVDLNQTVSLAMTMEGYGTTSHVRFSNRPLGSAFRLSTTVIDVAHVCGPRTPADMRNVKLGPPRMGMKDTTNPLDRSMEWRVVADELWIRGPL
jgi:hypothetical protein